MPFFYLPSLFDRLVDEHPRQKTEAPNERAMDLRAYRAMVERDLELLLNASPLPKQLHGSAPRAPGADRNGLAVSDFPLVQKSVVNYGLRDLSGVALTHELTSELERQMELAIERFEPRVQNVRVRRVTEDDLKVEAEKRLFREKMQLGVVGFAIEVELYAEPLPEHLRFKTEFDSKSGRHTLA
jgi:type VI secretion system protein ImpF